MGISNGFDERKRCVRIDRNRTMEGQADWRRHPVGSRARSKALGSSSVSFVSLATRIGGLRIQKLGSKAKHLAPQGSDSPALRQSLNQWRAQADSMATAARLATRGAGLRHQRFSVRIRVAPPISSISGPVAQLGRGAGLEMPEVLGSNPSQGHQFFTTSGSLAQSAEAPVSKVRKVSVRIRWGPPSRARRRADEIKGM